ncbi:hypothetical protein CYMTET_26306, partial [Cymbomonas tetramitiformis]
TSCIDQGVCGGEAKEKKARPVFSSLPLLEICRGVKGGKEIRGRGKEEGVLQAGKSRITSALGRGVKGIQEGLKPTSAGDGAVRDESLDASRRGEAEVSPGEEGALEVTVWHGGGARRGSGAVGEEGQEEEGRNYSTKLVKVEGLLSLRLALLLVLLLMVLRGVTLLKVLLLRRRLLLKRMRRVLMRHPGGGEGEGGVL